MREDSELTFCTAKDYLLKRMPKFDQGYLPPAVTVDGASMFDGEPMQCRVSLLQG